MLHSPVWVDCSMHKRAVISKDLYEIIIRGNQQERDAALNSCHNYFNSNQKELDEGILAKNLERIASTLKTRSARMP